MKKLLLLLFFISAVANAQIINFPDANFKAKLLAASPDVQIAYSQGNFVKIDTDNDGEIEVSEAVVIDSLEVNAAGISNLIGISAFTNLKGLACQGNFLTSLDLTGQANLRFLRCYSNQISTLNIAGLTNLNELDCSGNLLSTLNSNGLPNLKRLSFTNNQFTAIDLTSLVNLETLTCTDNLLVSLQIHGLSNLKYINCAHNLLPNLDTIGLSGLEELYCSSNSMTSFDATGLTSLKYITITYNNLTTLNVSGATNLVTLDCEGNLLTDINLSNLAHLEIFGCGIGLSNNGTLASLNASGCTALQTLTINNQSLASLNLSGCNSLTTIYAQDNQLTSVDFSDCISLTAAYLQDNAFITLDFSHAPLTYLPAYNNQLQSLYIKNGAVTDAIVANNPNLTFVCIDDTEMAIMQSRLVQAGLQNTAVLNSYCSFTPGGNYNTISGIVHFDADNNGCDASDILLPMFKITGNDGTNQGATFTNATGQYSFFVQQPDLTVTPVVENPNFYNVSPTSAIFNFPTNNGTIQTQNFCVTANGVHPDLEIVIIPISTARPGFNAIYQITARNKGNQTLSGEIHFGYNDTVLDFVSASVLPSASVGGLLTWNYTDLQPFASSSYIVTLNLNSPQETPPVNIGYQLDFTSLVTPLTADETSIDNLFSFKQIVVGSLDPNDKTCLEGNIVTPTKIGDYLHYNINFENTGTAAAENIVVKDMIDTAKFDISTLQIMNASHPVTTRITGNKVEFIFENINLGASQHGNVVFKIKTKPTLITGDSVTNKADIYFDYNFPVATNTANTIFQALGVSQNTFDNAISVFPNPANGLVNLKSGSVIKSVYVFDVQGRVVATSLNNENDVVLDVSNYTSGIYYLKIVTEEGIDIEKLIKK